MLSDLDTFLSECQSTANTVMGTASITLSGGTILTGVWSPVMSSTEPMSGGEQLMVTRVVTVPTAAAITDALIGQTGTYDGQELRVDNVERDGVDTHVSFVHATEALMEL